MKVELQNGHILLIDEADWAAVSQYSWYADKAYSTYYARSNTLDRKTTILLHRLLLNFPKEHVDHWDGNGLNNQRSNLRLATAQQNNVNSKSRGGSSRFKGVYYRRDTHKWCAQIGYGRTKTNRGCHTLGCFLTEEEAAHAYDVKATELYGEFARLNFPVEVQHD